MISRVYDEPELRMLVQELTLAFLEGRWRAEDLAERGAGRLDRWPAWMNRLAFDVVAEFREPPLTRAGELFEVVAAWLRAHPPGAMQEPPPTVMRFIPVVGPRSMRGARAIEYLSPIEPVESVPALAERLELSLGQLEWLADVRGLERSVSAERLRNYRYRSLPRRGGLPRVIEAPKMRLKEVQRWMLRAVLDAVPAHGAAHGFVRGRSAATHAAVHLDRPMVLRLDLEDFFASVPAGRVHGIFGALGYPRAVAHVLTGLATNVVPASMWDRIAPPAEAELVGPRFRLGRRLATPHLPQGAPSSPALANLAAFSLDRRVAGLAAAVGLTYSRYVDDLTFSGPVLPRRRRAAFVEAVAAIARAEGFILNRRKELTRTRAQRQTVTGVVVNVRPNAPRAEYDRLRATLHRAATEGVSAARVPGVWDLESHLRGRIAWMASLNPARGERLRRMFDAVDWSS